MSSACTLQAGDYWYGLAVSAYGIGAAVGTLIAGGHTFRWPLPRILLVATPCYAFTAVLGVLAEAHAVVCDAEIMRTRLEGVVEDSLDRVVDAGVDAVGG